MKIWTRMQGLPANRVHLAPTAALIGAAALLGGAALPAQPEKLASDITVTVTNLRSSAGVVRACLTTQAKEFPKCDDDGTSIRVAAPAAGSVTLSFKHITPGRYAIALLHDENNNGKADRALMMMPTEGYGFSRDAKVRMGPPKFADAAFDVIGAPVFQTIKMRYML